MNIEEFKTKFPGILIAAAGVDSVKWYHFHDNEDLRRYVSSELSETLASMFLSSSPQNQKRFGEDESFDYSVEWQEFCNDSEVLLQALTSDIKKVLKILVIVTNNLTEAEWNKLHQADAWPNQQTFVYWKKLTEERTFDDLLRVLGLEKNSMIELFGISNQTFELWLTGKIPLPALNKLIELDEIIDMKVVEWVAYYKDLKALPNYQPVEDMGIPSYDQLEDYQYGELELIKHLPNLELHKTFRNRLAISLTNQNINVSPVNISFDRYFRWLKGNSYTDAPGARIIYATELLQKKKLRKNDDH